MEIKNIFKLYQALLIFLGVALWVVLAAGIVENFKWDAVFDMGLLIHSGIILISFGCTALIIKSFHLSALFNALSFKKSIWQYYLIALIFAIVVWLADFWLQQFFFLDDGKKDALVLQAEIKQFGLLNMVISSCLLAPVAEEFLFRGILLKGLMEKISPFFAVLISSIWFAAIHFSAQDFISLFAAAFGYALLTIKAGSIQPALLAHVINNILTVYYLAIL